jgi:hypothetical protein
MTDKVRVRDHIFSKTAVHRIAGVLLALAKCLPAAEDTVMWRR